MNFLMNETVISHLADTKDTRNYGCYLFVRRKNTRISANVNQTSTCKHKHYTLPPRLHQSAARRKVYLRLDCFRNGITFGRLRRSQRRSKKTFISSPNWTNKRTYTTCLIRFHGYSLSHRWTTLIKLHKCQTGVFNYAKGDYTLYMLVCVNAYGYWLGTLPSRA